MSRHAIATRRDLEQWLDRWRADTLALADAIDGGRGLPEALQLAAQGLREADVLVRLRRKRLPVSVLVGKEPVGVRVGEHAWLERRTRRRDP